jgi:twitching motility protein PilJ
MEKRGIRLNIQGKLMLACMAMISLTLVVSVIAFISQRFAQSTIDNVVQVQGKIARLSLETDNKLKLMAGHEKDFFLNYKGVGIQEAKKQYLNGVITEGGETYKILYEIQKIAQTTEERNAAQLAMDAINEYLGAFISTVNILELRVDPEFGELVKLTESGDKLRQAVKESNYAPLGESFLFLKDAVKDYVALPGESTAKEVNTAFAQFGQVLKGTASFSGEIKKNLKVYAGEYQNWFSVVNKTDKSIAARVAAYTVAAKKAEPIIQSFLDKAILNEAEAISRMDEKGTMMAIVILVVGILAIILGGIIAIGLSRGLTRQVNHIMGLLGEIGMGNFDARTEVVSSDELGTMATTLNAMLDNITVLIQSQDERDKIQDSIMKLLEEISDLTEGDLTARAEVTEDITGAIADSFNTMAVQFGDIIRQVKSTTASVDDTSADVNMKTVELAEKSGLQAKQVQDTVNSISTMVKSIHNVSKNASKSAEVSSLSRTHAREGAVAVSDTNKAIEEIREQINETARSIKRLGESSLEIGNVIQIINDIADRTSILALNASIQAAMAGDAGHGFAVVAEEVQRLAESSGNSTKQIEILVKSIQAEIKDVGNRMDESIAKVVQGTKLANNAHEKLQEIETVSSQLAELIEAITLAAGEQVKVSESIATSMQEVGEVSKETSRASQETAQSMDALSTTAHTLREAVEMFNIETAPQPA